LEYKIKLFGKLYKLRLNLEFQKNKYSLYAPLGFESG